MTGRLCRPVALFAVLLLAGCAAALPQPHPQNQPVEPPALTQTQLTTVLGRVGAVLGPADKTFDPATLPQRLSGPALAMRTSEYIRAKATDGAKTPVALPTTEASAVLPQTTTWPRTVLSVTQQPDDLSAQRVLVLRQDSARGPYTLWGWARLFPDTTVPTTPALEVGSAVVPDASKDLVVPPADLLNRYADVLANGTGSASAATFAADAYRTAVEQNRTLQKDGVAQGGGSFTETYAAVGPPVVALRTSNGGALVVGQLTTTSTTTAAKGGTLSNNDPWAAALAGQAPSGSLTRTYTDVLVFYVPSAAAGGQVVALAAEQILTGAAAS